MDSLSSRQMPGIIHALSTSKLYKRLPSSRSHTVSTPSVLASYCTIMSLHVLLLLVVSWFAFVNSEALFLRLVDAESASFSHCKKLKVEYGGGIPPYQLWSWSETENKMRLGQQSMAPGRITWRMHDESIMSYPGIFLRDATQETIKIPPHIIKGSVKPGCSGIASLETRTLKPPQRPVIQDCASGGPAYCSFTPLVSLQVKSRSEKFNICVLGKRWRLPAIINNRQPVCQLCK